jgi:magnesium-transporting ATPase (P-type)
MALGAEKPEPGIMQRPPRKRNKPLLDRALFTRSIFFIGILQTVLCYAAFFFVYWQAGYTDFLHLPRVDRLPLDLRMAIPEGMIYVMATTVFHAGVVMGQIGNALASRTAFAHTRQIGAFTNKELLLAIMLELVIILTLIYVWPFNELFEHVPLPPIYLLGVALFAPITYGADWVRKAIVRRHLKTHVPAASS